MNRRRFLASSAGVAGAALTRGGRATSVWAAENTIEVEANWGKPAGALPPDFMGLGYEISSVARAGLLSASNKKYVQLVKLLGERGVIRVGGNTSDVSSYSPSASAVSSPRATVVNDAVLSDLGGFLKATGWKLIWGLNLGGGTVDAAIAEAEAVMRSAKGALVAFEIGNEPDLFGGPHRPRPYDYADYLKEYRRYKQALRLRFPMLPLAGPDVANHTEWLTQFASDEGSDLKLLTHHYYAEGPPQNPTSTIENLLRTDAKLTRMLAQCVSAAESARLPYRICETNSCFGGGKPGVSDTFASALWGLDFLFTLAAGNASGLNMETGVNQLGFISSYSPIGDDEQGSYTARPLYYGMLAFSQAARGQRTATAYDRRGMNVKAYATEDCARLSVTAINKEKSSDVSFRIALPGSAKRGKLMRLTGPSLDSKAGVAFAGAAVDAAGRWAPSQVETVYTLRGACEVRVSAASAAVVVFDS